MINIPFNICINRTYLTSKIKAIYPTLLQIVEDASIGHLNDNLLRVNFKNKMIITQTNEKQGRVVLSYLRFL